MKFDYDTEARKLAKAIDIANDSFVRFPINGFTQENINHFVTLYTKWKQDVLNPEVSFKNKASLKYQIDNVFTYFQEANGETVEYFWKQLAKENLGYKRNEKLLKIMNRGKIRDQIEFEYVVDIMLAAEQEGKITQAESKILNSMIGEYENTKQQ